ncbi:MAG: DUF2892 domain-containing protein [Candidatus Altiarchaeota archaeon]|nr:DUF2892 domain-containing protein [Candidatus Altiarchaeota archaeon]
MNLEKIFLEENVGGWDLFIRAAIGAAGTAAYSTGLVTATEPWNWIITAVIFVTLFSGMTRHCTPYALLGISTARNKKVLQLE